VRPSRTVPNVINGGGGHAILGGQLLRGSRSLQSADALNLAIAKSASHAPISILPGAPILNVANGAFGNAVAHGGSFNRLQSLDIAYLQRLLQCNLKPLSAAR